MKKEETEETEETLEELTEDLERSIELILAYPTDNPDFLKFQKILQKSLEGYRGKKYVK